MRGLMRVKMVAEPNDLLRGEPLEYLWNLKGMGGGLGFVTCMTTHMTLFK